MLSEMPSLSDRSSARFLVPRTFLRVVWASSRVDECALVTLATAEMGQYTRKYTTPSTDTVTESLVRICKCFKKLQFVYWQKLQTVCDAWDNRDRQCAFIIKQSKNIPLEEGYQRTQFSDLLSQSYRCRVILGKVLEKDKSQFRW